MSSLDTTPGAVAPVAADTSVSAPEPIISLTNLTAGFAAATGTHAVAIAGILKSTTGRYNAKDILNGSAKMYAGVNGAITKTAGSKPDAAGGAIPDAAPATFDMTTPTDWVYRLTDSYTKSLMDNRRLTKVEPSDVLAAQDMFKQIYTLTSTPYAEIVTTKFNRLGQIIPKGTTFAGQRFQLLFKYTPSATPALNGTGYIRYGNKDTDIKSFNVKDSKVTAEDDGLMGVLDLLNSLIGDGKIEIESAPALGMTEGGKSASRKRQMVSKKGGRNNSASRKQNKKGGAKTRRSQKGGKRVR